MGICRRVGIAAFNIWDLVFTLVSPLLLGLVIAFTYRQTYRGVAYDVGFVYAVILFAMITSFITLIIGNNVARAFGLVGALSIIRFRSPMKSPLDAVYIFWALGTGMACGTGLYLAGLGLALFLALTLLVFHKLQFGYKAASLRVLRVVAEPEHCREVQRRVEEVLKTNPGVQAFSNIDHSDAPEGGVSSHYRLVLRTGAGAPPIDDVQSIPHLKFWEYRESYPYLV